MATCRITQTTPCYDSLGFLVFLCQKGEISTGSPKRGRQIEVGEFRQRISTNISLYLRNGAKQGYSYYGTLIGTHMCSVDWCTLFPVTLSDPNYTKPPYFGYFFIAFHIFVVSGVIWTSNVLEKVSSKSIFTFVKIVSKSRPTLTIQDKDAVFSPRYLTSDGLPGQCVWEA